MMSPPTIWRSTRRQMTHLMQAMSRRSSTSASLLPSSTPPWKTMMKMMVLLMTTRKNGRLSVLLLPVRHRRTELARRTRWQRSRATMSRLQLPSVVGIGMWMTRRL